MDGKKPKRKAVTFTVMLDANWSHDIRSVRLLLKRLLRAYGLKCVDIDGQKDTRTEGREG